MDIVPGKPLFVVCAIYYNNLIGFVKKEIWRWVQMCQPPLGLFILHTYVIYI